MQSEYPEDVMKLAEEALDNLLCNCTKSCGGYDGLRAASISDIARAIMADRASRTDMTDRPAIKALEWGKTSYGTPEVNTVVGVYRLNRAGNGGWSASIKNELLRDSDGRTNFATLEEAKAAAQSDFASRIRSCLLDKPEAVEATSPQSNAVGSLISRWREGEFETTADEAAQDALDEQAVGLDVAPIIEAWLSALAERAGNV